MNEKKYQTGWKTLHILFDEYRVQQTPIFSYVNLFIQQSRIRELCYMPTTLWSSTVSG